MKILITFLAVFSAPAFAQTRWDCNDGRLESAGISQHGNHLEGEISWACLPGDGICTAGGPVTEVQDKNGDLSYHGNHFWLVVHVSQPARNGEYKAHLIAYDKEDGFPYNGFVSCR